MLSKSTTTLHFHPNLFGLRRYVYLQSSGVPNGYVASVITAPILLVSYAIRLRRDISLHVLFIDLNELNFFSLYYTVQLLLLA